MERNSKIQVEEVCLYNVALRSSNLDDVIDDPLYDLIPTLHK